MEKNHTLFENFETAKNKMIPCSTNLIFYNDAFSKTKFMSKIMELSEDPIIYLDFDLLFSGYLESEYIEKPPNMEIIKLDKENLKELLEVLNEEGVTIVGEMEEYDYGKFGWILDPEGNKIELWEPVDKAFL